ncbi:hypothetical protein QFZ53_001425 [Microbacterium natoriense]|uniref:KAP NTPase domain-containing protein n=1 Tax=Microbacterium natoriense TaxID=284570 RepID=A0AAW8EWI1_9MICO|nr:P-loop NTPase fold protein [Microbacterium natoriense]MDQ0647229.1 hypothetical protein [Microbacterium natoriense]
MRDERSARQRAKDGWLRFWGHEVSEDPHDDGASVASTSKSFITDESNAAIAPRFGRADFLRRAWEIIDEARTEEDSSVFGLVGPWGSGKTSMLDWLRAKATEEPADADTTPWTVLTFNPWDYPDAGTLQLGFFGSLNASFGSSKFDAARDLLSDFGVAVAPLTAVASAWGIFDASKVVEGAAKLLGSNRSADAARRKLVDTLKKAKTPVLIVIDDLDRISADELLLTLKLVRQLGRLPYVHYLLSYDESTILDVLTRTNLIGDGQLGRARDYMEKVVQIRFDVPQLRPSDVSELTNEALMDLEADTGHVIDDLARPRFQEAYERFISRRLTTPRALLRYFAQARILSQRFAGEVDLVDFLILTWIRTFEPGVYALLQTRRDELIGSVAAHVDPQERRSPDTIRADWAQAFVDAGTRESETAGVISAVASLFPRFAQSTGSPSGGSSHLGPHIASEDYFDRYFTAGVPDGDLRDSVVRQAIQDFEDGVGETSEAAKSCVSGLETNPNRTAPKIAAAAGDANIKSPATFRWLADMVIQDFDRAKTLDWTLRIHREIARQLKNLPRDDVEAVLRAMSGGRRGAVVATSARWATEMEPDDVPPLEFSSGARRAVTDALRDLLATEDASVVNMRWRVREALTDWDQIDPDGFAAWVDEQKRTHGQLETLSWFARLSVSFPGGIERTRIEGFRTDDARKHFDFEEIASKYADELPDGYLKMDDTPENRRTAALGAVAEAQARP